MTCPDCRGAGETVAAHVLYSDGSGRSNVPMKCGRCHGVGAVPDEMAAWIAAGQRCRTLRVHGRQHRDLRDVGRASGLGTVTVSKMERGELDPAPLTAYWERIDPERN